MATNSLDQISQVDYRKAVKYALRAISVGLVPFITSSPGWGKSSIPKKIAEILNAELIDVRLSYREPTDIGGYPAINSEGFAYYAPFNSMFPTENTPVPKGKNGWVIVLDEYTSCSEETQAATYQLILDKMVGQYKLHKDVAIICLGNNLTDKAIVNVLSSAINSRLIHIKLKVNTNQWLEDFAIPNKLDTRVIAWINANPSFLNDFDPNKSGESYTVPRTVESLSKLVNGIDDLTDLLPLLQGTITPGKAAHFVTFSKVFKDLPSLETILADPIHATLPEDTSTRWALICTLSEATNKDNAASIFKYISRMPMDLKAMFTHMIITHLPDAIDIPEVRSVAVEVGKVLTGN